MPTAIAPAHVPNKTVYGSPMYDHLYFTRLWEGMQRFDMTPYVNGRVMTGLAAIGLYFAVKALWKPISAFYRILLRPRRSLKSRYGGNWALVTGASQGIGEQYCYELAKSGFNIILMSRSGEKLDDVATKLRNQYKVETRIVEFNFLELSNVEGVNKLKGELDKITEDVCILVNNAGTARKDVFHLHPPQDFFREFYINDCSQFVMSQYFIPKFLDRYNRLHKHSAIINVSSITGLDVKPQNAVYAATKAFSRALSMGMQRSYPNEIDVMTVLPRSVKTNMNTGGTPFTIRPVTHAKAVIDQLGWEKETVGHWWHEFQTFMM